MLTEVAYLNPGDQPLQRQLGFNARSVIVDNYTGNYVNLDGGRPCPPYTVGWVTVFTSGRQIGGASLVPASGAASAPVLPTTPAFNVILTFTDQIIPLSNGVSLMPLNVNIGTITGTVTVAGNVGIVGTVQVNIASQSGTVNVQFPSAQNVNIANTPAVTISSGTVNATITGTPNINIQSQTVNLNTQQPQTSLGNFVVAAGPSTNSALYTLPAGCHAVGIMVKASGLLNLSVTGATTGTNYISLVGNAALGYFLSGYFVSPVLSVLDTQVTVSGTTAAAQGPTTVYSVAILDAEGVYIFDNTRQPAGVFLTDVSGNAINDGTPLKVGIPLSTAGFGQQGTWTTTSVSTPAAAATAATLVVANSSRRGLFLYSEGVTGGLIINVHSKGEMFQIPAGGYWEMPSPVDTEQIDMTTTANNQGGSIKVTELT